MRKLTTSEALVILLMAVGTFLFGLYLGNHNAEQNLYSMFSKLGSEATQGNEDAKSACKSLVKMKDVLDKNKTSRHIYWLIALYGNEK